MAIDFGSIIQALGAADQAAEESNPYKPLADIGEQLGALTIKNALNKGDDGKPMYDFKDNLVAGLVSGLIGGAFTGLGDRYEAKQSSLASQAIGNLLTGGPSVLSRPDGMSPSVFRDINKLNTAMKVSNYQDLLNNELSERKSQKDFGRELNIKAAEAILKNPYSAKRGLELLARMGEPKTESIVESPGKSTGVESGDEQSDNYFQVLERFGGNEALAADAIKRELDKPDKAVDLEHKLRQQFLNHPTVQQFSEVARQFSALQSAANDPSTVSDLDFVYGVAKTLDPGSVVRESEMGLVIDSQSIPETMLGRLNKYLQGDPAIRAQGREGMLDLVQRRYDVNKRSVDSLSKQFGGIAEGLGANPGNVTILADPTVEAATAQSTIPPQFLRELAAQYPNTPEGKAMFRAEVEQLKANGR